MKKLILIAQMAVSLIFIGFTATAQNDVKMETKEKTLVAYFSRADENYGVGYVKEGNTQVIATMIANELKADIFQIVPEKAYPAKYDDCVELAKKEKNADVRPEVVGDVKVEDYDVIYLGYPNWWSDAPMAVYTFIEKHNWNNKKVIPFVTHEGSGIGGTDKLVGKACKGAIMGKAFGMYGHVAQNQRDKALQEVKAFVRGK